jgi:hypothetical protein
MDMVYELNAGTNSIDLYTEGALMLATNGSGNGKVSKYTVMYEETPVLLFDRKADAVTV